MQVSEPTDVVASAIERVGTTLQKQIAEETRDWPGLKKSLNKLNIRLQLQRSGYTFSAHGPTRASFISNPYVVCLFSEISPVFRAKYENLYFHLHDEDGPRVPPVTADSVNAGGISFGEQCIAQEIWLPAVQNRLKDFKDDILTLASESKSSRMPPDLIRAAKADKSKLICVALGVDRLGRVVVMTNTETMEIITKHAIQLFAAEDAPFGKARFIDIGTLDEIPVPPPSLDGSAPAAKKTKA